MQCLTRQKLLDAQTTNKFGGWLPAVTFCLVGFYLTWVVWHGATMGKFHTSSILVWACLILAIMLGIPLLVFGLWFLGYVLVVSISFILFALKTNALVVDVYSQSLYDAGDIESHYVEYCFGDDLQYHVRQEISKNECDLFNARLSRCSTWQQFEVLDDEEAERRLDSWMYDVSSQNLQVLVSYLPNAPQYAQYLKIL